MSHRYRLYPTPEQAAGLQRHCDDSRFVWNLAATQLDHLLRYRPAGRWPSYVDRCKQLTEARAGTWLGEGSAAIQQQALRDFDRALKNWWGNPSHFGRPRHRTRRRKRTDSFGMAANACFQIRSINRRYAEIRVQKVGWVRFRTHRALIDVKSIRIVKDRAGRWWISLVTKPAPIERTPTGHAVGVDRGIVNTIALSDGTLDHIPTLTPNQARRRLTLQRRLARQQHGSRRRERTRTQIARIDARLADQQRDWIEKTTTRLIRDHDLIAVEDLNILGMTRSARGTVDKPGVNVTQKAALNRQILAQSWGRWLHRLQQKADLAGVAVVRVPAQNTSRRCHACGHTAPENRDNQAVFECVSCGHRDHADTNAARNILAAGLAVTGRGGPDGPCEASTGQPLAA